MRINTRCDLDFNPKSEIRNLKLNRGFTLVELLVAVALTIAIMGIIGWAMGRSVETFRQLNATVNLQTKLVATQMVLQRDLSSEHFGGIVQPQFGGPQLSDQRLDLIGWRPPEEGFFAIYQGSSTPSGPAVQSVDEGMDSDGVRSFRSVCHSLHFTVKLSGKREEDYFYSPATATLFGNATSAPPDFRRNPNIIASQWAEVFYFLWPTGEQANNGLPIYALYRRQRLLLPANTNASLTWTSTNQRDFPNISCNIVPGTTNTTTLSTSASVTVPEGTAFGYPPAASPPWPRNRLPVIPVPGAPVAFAASPESGTIWGTRRIEDTPLVNANQMRGDDILMTGVLSFEVKVLWTHGNASATSEQVLNFNPANPATHDWPYALLPNSPRNSSMPGKRFDTWSTQVGPPTFNWDDANQWSAANSNGAQVPLRIRIHQLQIRVRVWDFNTQQTRQLCFVQDV